MPAESQQPYTPYTRQELLRRPLEPYTAFAIDDSNTWIAEDAFHAQHYPSGTLVSAYLPDVAYVRQFPEIMNDVEARWLDPGTEDSYRRLLPRFLLRSLSLTSDSGTDYVPAIAIRYKGQESPLAIEDMQKVRVKVQKITYSEYACSVNSREPEACDLATALPTRNGDYLSGRYTVGQLWAKRVVAAHTITTNTLVAKIMKEHEIPCIYRHVKKPPRNIQRMGPVAVAMYSANPMPYDIKKPDEYTTVTIGLQRLSDFVNLSNLSAFLEGSPYPFKYADVDRISRQHNAKKYKHLNIKSNSLMPEPEAA